jgi:hypothetical protein
MLGNGSLRMGISACDWSDAAIAECELGGVFLLAIPAVDVFIEVMTLVTIPRSVSQG